MSSEEGEYDSNNYNENENVNSNRNERNNYQNEEEELGDIHNLEIYSQEIFDYFCKKGEKYLNIKSTKQALRSMGIPITEKEIMKILKIKKKTGNEKITFEMFQKCSEEFKKNENVEKNQQNVIKVTFCFFCYIHKNFFGGRKHETHL